jgi:oligoendopeptidase F
MKALYCILAALLLLGTSPTASYQIDLTRFFPSPSAEIADRASVESAVRAFVGSPVPKDAEQLFAWIQTYNALLETLKRHSLYVDLRAEEDDNDIADAKADDYFDELIDEVQDRVVEVAGRIGADAIADYARDGRLAPYRYMLENALADATHRLTPAQSKTVDTVVKPVLDAAATSYKAMRKLPGPAANHQEAYAALLVSIAAARNGVARLRGFDGAPEAAYFDRGIPVDYLEPILQAVRASNVYAHYQSVASHAPHPVFTPAKLTVAEAIPVILAAEQPMGSEYASAYASLLDPANGRLEICIAQACDDDGFSVGFAGLESGVYYGLYDGSVSDVRAVAHESGHAVHREFMSRYQPIPAYNIGPNFMFESFAIFNELLFIDHLYRAARSDAERAYYLNYFIKDAAFQVFGSAEETELEAAIYRGVDKGTIRTAADFDALAAKIFAQYDPASTKDPNTALYWARDRLYFTDPLYDVNYLYAGLLALRYFNDFQHDPDFAKHYVALLKNGFNAPPKTLLAKFLGIDLSDARGLVANAAALIDARTNELSKLYAPSRMSGRDMSER